jgi:Glycosyl transferase family 2
MAIPRVGLVMICRNEETNIERAMTSVRPWINTWVIVDTGSTDRTKEIIKSTFADLSGYLEERPWKNFGHNRTEALELCRDRMDWAIMLDADDNMVGEVLPPKLWSMPDIDGFMIKIRHGNIIHQRVQIFRIAADWVYSGVVHEYAVLRREIEKPRVAMLPSNCWMQTRCEGFRSRDPNKYLKDAQTLEVEHCKNPTDARIIFYMAQSYRDAGRHQDAQKWYQKYVDMSGGWEQEKYISCMNLINMVDGQERIMRLAWQGIQLCPERLEVQSSTLLRFMKEQWKMTHELYSLMMLTKNRKTKEGWLFANPQIYSLMFDDMVAVVAFQTEHYTDSYDASIRVAVHPEATDEQRLKALTNARNAQAKLSA